MSRVPLSFDIVLQKMTRGVTEGDQGLVGAPFHRKKKGKGEMRLLKMWGHFET